MQGMFKFGLYEVFKVQYANLVGEEISYEYRTSLYLVSSASAEFFADIGLAPFEAAKVIEKLIISNSIKLFADYQLFIFI